MNGRHSAGHSHSLVGENKGLKNVCSILTMVDLQNQSHAVRSMASPWKRHNAVKVHRKANPAYAVSK